MSASQHVHVVELLNRLGDLEPTAERTRRAVDQVRRALFESAPSAPPRRIVLKWTAAAALIMVAVTGALFAWLLQSPTTARASFADVLTAVESSESMTCRMVTRIEGKPAKTVRLSALGNGLSRDDRADGTYTVTDFKNDRSLVVDPQNRKATLWQNARPVPINPYEFFKNLPNHASARALPGKKIDGKEALGFSVKAFEQEHDLTVWADPATRLPVRIELRGIENQEATEIIFDEIVFDRELNASLFSFEPPAGYKLETIGVAEFPTAPTDREQRELMVTPRKGIGPVTFEMKREQVEQLLGKPDGERAAGHVILNYGSRGVFIGVGKETGVLSISCYSQSAMALKVRDFSGQTDKGIKLGASVADIVRAYGEPDSKETKMGSTYLVYEKLQAHFTLFGDKLVAMDFYRPRG